MTMKSLFQALIASVIVAIPFAFASITFASGNLLDVMSHSGFWVIYAKSVFWFFLVGFLASALTAILILRRRNLD